MNDGSLFALAFAAGMVATINPCGFAMLPAYLSYFLGVEGDDAQEDASVFRAIGVGLAVSGGFLSVFIIVGIAITSFSLQIEAYLPWATIVIGIGLGVLGVAMIRGYQPLLHLPRVTRSVTSREIGSMFLFGVSYAVASLSCTIGVFLTTVSFTFTRRDFWSGLQVFVAYALGMGLVLTVLTVALALARQSFVRSFRRVLPVFHRVSGGLLVLAGGYLCYYGWYELRVSEGDLDAGGPANAVFDLSASIATWVQETGSGRVGLILVALLVAGVILGIGLRSSRGSRGVTQPD